MQLNDLHFLWSQENNIDWRLDNFLLRVSFTWTNVQFNFYLLLTEMNESYYNRFICIQKLKLGKYYIWSQRLWPKDKPYFCIISPIISTGICMRRGVERIQARVLRTGVQMPVYMKAVTMNLCVTSPSERLLNTNCPADQIFIIKLASERAIKTLPRQSLLGCKPFRSLFKKIAVYYLALGVKF